MNLLLILLLTLLNGLFAMSEMALAASRKARLDALAAAQKPGASAALALMEHPTNFLSTVQVGITSIGLLNGIVGDSAFSPIVARWLLLAGVPERVAHFSATALVVTGITFITLIFGELVPKRIGQIYPEQIAAFMARPMTWLSRAARPFVLLLSNTTHAVLRLLPFDTQSTRSVTQEEIAASLVEGVDAGLIEEHEHRMVRNVFKLDERALSSIMVPRNEVVWLDAHTTVAQALHKLSAGDMRAHSWYPVCRESLDNVVGLVRVAHMLDVADPKSVAVSDLAVAANYVPETLSGFELLEQFRARAGRMIFVVDEYGVVQGIITPRDLLEAITGELKPGAASEAWAVQNEDGSWYLDGLMPVSELKSRLEIKELPDEDKGRYNTLAGMLMAESGHMPPVGEKIYCAGWVFEVTALEGKRVDKVIARPDLGDADY